MFCIGPIVGSAPAAVTPFERAFSERENNVAIGFDAALNLL
jgi:hypothetical protein